MTTSGALANAKWNLDDDYVKFIRFGQWRIDQTGSGIMALITNHAFRDNATFRQMRRSLMTSFDGLSILDLHGDSRRGEASPDGLPDTNVFDIQQGVSIGLFVRHEQKPHGGCKVRFSELWGTRPHKYEVLLATSCESSEWSPLQPREPQLLLKPQDDELAEEYYGARRSPHLHRIHRLRSRLREIRSSLHSLPASFDPNWAHLWTRWSLTRRYGGVLEWPTVAVGRSERHEARYAMPAFAMT